ncbi:unnamed protein product [Amoebophrya sp. A25]|nr:unnamed protein product [Amoebophrya sp. A25]|eukprot:GSA25T00001161001.1
MSSFSFPSTTTDDDLCERDAMHALCRTQTSACPSIVNRVLLSALKTLSDFGVELLHDGDLVGSMGLCTGAIPVSSCGTTKDVRIFAPHVHEDDLEKIEDQSFSSVGMLPTHKHHDEWRQLSSESAVFFAERPPKNTELEKGHSEQAMRLGLGSDPSSFLMHSWVALELEGQRDNPADTGAGGGAGVFMDMSSVDRRDPEVSNEGAAMDKDVENEIVHVDCSGPAFGVFDYMRFFGTWTAPVSIRRVPLSAARKFQGGYGCVNPSALRECTASWPHFKVLHDSATSGKEQTGGKVMFNLRGVSAETLGDSEDGAGREIVDLIVRASLAAIWHRVTAHSLSGSLSYLNGKRGVVKRIIKHEESQSCSCNADEEGEANAHTPGVAPSWEVKFRGFAEEEATKATVILNPENLKLGWILT